MPETTPRRLSRHLGERSFWIVFALALGIRLVVLYQLTDAPGASVPFLDEQRYLELAVALAEGTDVGETLFWQSPLYPWLLSWIPVEHESLPMVAKILQAILGAVTCGLTFLLGARIGGRRIGVGAGLIMAFYGPAIFFGTQLLATTLATFWTVALVLLAADLAQKPRPFASILFGLCAGLSVLTRASFLPFVLLGLMGLWLAWRVSSQKRVALLVLGVVVPAALMVGPALVERERTTGALTILPISAGINLHIGNNEDRCAAIQVRGYQWDQLVREPFSGSMDPEEKTDAVGDGYFREKFGSYVRTHPQDYVSGLAFKAIQLVNGTEIPRNVDMYVYREWSWLHGLLTWRAGPFGFPFGVVFPLAVLGAIRAHRRIPWPVFLLLATYGFSIIAVFVTARYRVPMIPLLAILSATGVEVVRDLAQSWKKNRRLDRNAGVAVIAAIAALLPTLLPTATCEHQTNFAGEYRRILGTHHLEEGRVPEAERHLRAAIRLDPSDGDAHYNLGHVALAKNDPQEAADHWRKALAVYPDHAAAQQNLGLVLLRLGDHEQAHRLLLDAFAAGRLSADDFANVGLQLIRENRLEAARLFLSTAVDHSTTVSEAHQTFQVLEQIGRSRR